MQSINFSIDQPETPAKTGFDDLDPSEQKDMLFQLQHGISPERHEQMKDYAKKLRTKYPHMSPKRITEKTAAYFKIKLVIAKPSEDDSQTNS